MFKKYPKILRRELRNVLIISKGLEAFLFLMMTISKTISKAS